MTLQQFFSSEDRWSKGCSARNKEGLPCNPRSIEAYSFCLQEAIFINYGGQYFGKAYCKLIDSIRSLYHNALDSTVSFNDHPRTTFQMLQAVLKKADV